MLSVRWVTFSGDLIALTFGVGDDHGRFDVYVNKTLWRTFDGYAASSGEETVYLALDDGDHTLEVRTTRYRNPASSGNLVRFKQVQVLETAYDEHTIQYTYDALSRLLEADYDNGDTVYTYGFDVAGNLTNMDGASRTYNAANQLSNDGTNTLTYDANGNLTNDGVNAYVWDRANRLLSHDGLDYVYDGNGNRISKDDSVDVTQYLLDLQPGLALVLREDDGTNTNHYVHGVRGVHAVNDGAGWTYPLQDGLNSVRGYVGANNTVESSISYSPVGVPDTSIVGPAFTGEWRDETEMQYHRARYLSPSLGVWASLDPFEGKTCTPMSLNGYSWVEGDVVNATDASGLCWLNSTSSEGQQQQCLEAWVNYATSVDLSDPTIRDLMNQEHNYWGYLPYTDFVNQWNDNAGTPPSSISYSQSGTEIIAVGVGVSMVDSPVPGPADIPGWVIIVAGLCVVGLSAIGIAVGGGEIVLPRRQTHRFSDTSDRANEGDEAIPIADVQGIRDWSRSRDIPVPIPRGRLPDGEDCNSFISMINGVINQLMDEIFFYDIGLLENCNSLPMRYRYRTPGEAYNSEFTLASGLNEGQPATRGPCRFLGTHHNVRGVNRGSVVCCPCCDEITNTITDRCGAV